MNDQSPPKRVTRARAAAKTNDAGVKTTKIATAASKAKVTRAASTTKRKTRADETQEEDENHEPEQIIEPEPAKSTRGRSKRAAVQAPPAMEEEAPALTRATRGRPKKAASETSAPDPPKATRGRAKKVEVPQEEEAIVVEEPPKRATRTRAATITKATAPKKTVKFEEPDKENIAPPAVNSKGKAKAETGTGLRAKPVRKPATAATRATRGRAKVVVEEKEEKSSPLSPKKATQVGATKENASDDELATMEKTPMKPLSRSPVKPPGSVFGTAKKLDFSTSITVNKASTAQDLGASVMASPARRPQSAFKESLKVSPQRVNLADSMLRSPFKPSLPAPQSAAASSSFKESLLQSPARRPQSPTKVSDNGSPSRSNNTKSLLSGTPNTFKMSRFTTPKTITKSAIRPGLMAPPSAFKASAAGSPKANDDEELTEMTAEPSLKFSGRLSSIMPREADPALVSSEPIVEATEDESAEAQPVDDPMEVDKADTIVVNRTDNKTTTPLQSPPRNSTGAFALRKEDENPFVDSDSEDELASDTYSPGPLAGFRISSHDFAPATPTPFTAICKTPRSSKSRKSLAPEQSSRKEKIGFTPLARQLNDWMAASPDKSEEDGANSEETSPTAGATDNVVSAEVGAVAQPSPVKSTFFEDEMSVRDELAVAPEPEIPEVSEPELSPVELDDEDLELAHEADEMSLLEPDQMEMGDEEETPAQELEHEELPQPTELTPSEASQEYGDENAIPLDPALFTLAPPVIDAPAPQTFSTPKRVLAERVCHTVSKVPLKAAADETPMRPSPKKRSASISRLPVQRPSGALTRNNTVISYSPTKNKPRAKSPRRVSNAIEEACNTPTKEETELWSTLGTPARTPRRDLDTALLKGAVVFVDVHTTEGADASVLFTELLTQMGARCIKSWNWNGNGEDGSKIGITHVVFKDGGKRTLEKARETNGVVSCVGVGWVLE
jgi:hypothetical protein